MPSTPDAGREQPDRPPGPRLADQRSRPDGMPEPTIVPELRYRIVCYELEGDNQTVILDATARAVIIVTGTLDENGTMRGQGTNAGPLPY